MPIGGSMNPLNPLNAQLEEVEPGRWIVTMDDPREIRSPVLRDLAIDQSYRALAKAARKAEPRDRG
jgi:hypothetical protein